MSKSIYTKEHIEQALEYWTNQLSESFSDTLPPMSDEYMSEDETQDVEVSQDADKEQFQPNTVGAVIELLKKSDLNDKICIRLDPENENAECMLIGISRSINLNGGVTFIDIGKGSPDSE